MIEINLQKELPTAGGSMTFDFQLKIEAGKVAAITGPSGSGKTTFLRLVAGLTRPKAGRISIAGTTWYDSERRINLPPQKRSIGFVFQNYSLFPNMSVLANLRYALSKNQPESDLDEIIRITGLEELKGRSPQTLSGGQKQRVALARALVRKPKLLLLDEALSALDREMRARLQDHILAVHQQLGLSVFLVSHDVAEIIKMAHHVVELKNGIIHKEGDPASIFSSQQLSGKFKFTGHITDIIQEDVISVISVMVGGNLVKVVATDSEDQQLNVGDEVLLVSKAFNPLIIKLNR